MTIQQMLIAGGKSTVLLTISSDRTTTYNVFTSAGSPVSPVDITLTINSGIYIGAFPGINATGAWPAGSSLTIINNGYITGGGGRGGFGGDYNTNGFSGDDGGDALTLGLNVIIDNTNGYIFGGGGGGGGGGGHQVGLGAAGGGGGGGGQGYNFGLGGLGGDGGGGGDGANGGDGSFSAAGIGGAGGVDGFYPVVGADGGNGGGWGDSGGAGVASPSRFGGSGGSGGYAILLNGYTVTWLGGNTAARVKGAVS